MAAPPRMIPILNIFEPIIFPTEILLTPRIAADMVTQNSGAEVPNATIVRPIINSETPNRLAILEAESTSHVAPLQITQKHIIRVDMSIKISITLFLKSDLYATHSITK